MYRFDEITELKLEANTWSDGPTSYDLILHTQAGMKITFGDFESKDEAQRYHAILMDMTAKNI